jgi:hypothetical protein
MGLLDTAKKFKEDVVEAVEEALEEVIGAGEQILGAGVDAAQEMGAAAAEAGQQLGTALGEKEGVPGALAAGVDLLASTAGAAGQGFLGAAAEGAQDLVEAYVDIHQAMATAAEQAGEDTIDVIVAGANDIKGTVVGGASTVAVAIAAGATIVADAVVSGVIGGLGAIGAGALGAYEKGTAALESMTWGTPDTGIDAALGTDDEYGGLGTTFTSGGDTDDTDTTDDGVAGVAVVVDTYTDSGSNSDEALEYEIWKIAYAIPITDRAGLVGTDNFNLIFGTYLVLASDGNIYDAATVREGILNATMLAGATDTYGTTTAMTTTLLATGQEVLTEYTADTGLDANILNDSNLSGISPFKIVENDTVLSFGLGGESFIVGWAYGNTTRPSFKYSTTIGQLLVNVGGGAQMTNTSEIYSVLDGGDAAPIQSTFSRSSITNFENNYESLVNDLVSAIIKSSADLSLPVFNFKKAKRKKISLKKLSIFDSPETGTVTDTAAVSTAVVASTSATTTTTTTY